MPLGEDLLRDGLPEKFGNMAACGQADPLVEFFGGRFFMEYGKAALPRELIEA